MCSRSFVATVNWSSWSNWQRPFNERIAAGNTGVFPFMYSVLCAVQSALLTQPGTQWYVCREMRIHCWVCCWYTFFSPCWSLLSCQGLKPPLMIILLSMFFSTLTLQQTKLASIGQICRENISFVSFKKSHPLALFSPFEKAMPCYDSDCA